tara:strand:- start:4182 stop:4739 length:558 start_codon:yes stop_codon:yes gene_type:complete
MIRGDSSDYELLEKWSKDFDCQGHYTCEIGVREGLGSKIIMDNCRNSYLHVGVDPYANLKYQHYDKGPAYTADYTDQMRDSLVADFIEYTNQGKFRLANTTDVAFMADPANQDSTFAFVHFDGPHMSKDVMTEAIWFANRAAPHTRFVFDDHNKYQMSIIAYALTLYGFKTIEAGDNKICLEKRT